MNKNSIELTRQKPRILIEVNRGMVTRVCSTEEELEVVFVDWDSIERGDNLINTYSTKVNRNWMNSCIELITNKVRMIHQQLKEQL